MMPHTPEESTATSWILWITQCTFLYVFATVEGGIYSALGLVSVGMTITMGIINFIIAYPKFAERLKQIGKSELWKDIKEFFGR